LWSREVNTTTDVVRESAAETVRVVWSAMHGVCDTLQRALAREGLAYAIATQLSGPSRYTTELTPDETVTVIDAMEVIGDTRITGDIAGVLFGDATAVAMGWTPLGIPEYAGYRWAVAHSMRQLQQASAAEVLRANVG
ncbi:MAG: hypothetical protein M3Y64_01540, partial [Gemmatimonadota bacterium]|nr:hypothetical protein [Gemmatimonadota bacterium]